MKHLKCVHESRVKSQESRVKSLFKDTHNALDHSNSFRVQKYCGLVQQLSQRLELRQTKNNTLQT